MTPQEEKMTPQEAKMTPQEEKMTASEKKMTAENVKIGPNWTILDCFNGLVSIFQLSFFLSKI